MPQAHGLAASGWNAAPTAGKIITRIAPLFGRREKGNNHWPPRIDGTARYEEGIKAQCLLPVARLSELGHVCAFTVA